MSKISYSEMVKLEPCWSITFLYTGTQRIRDFIRYVVYAISKNNKVGLITFGVEIDTDHKSSANCRRGQKEEQEKLHFIARE